MPPGWRLARSRRACQPLTRVFPGSALCPAVLKGLLGRNRVGRGYRMRGFSGRFGAFAVFVEAPQLVGDSPQHGLFLVERLKRGLEASDDEALDLVERQPDRGVG